MAVLKLHALLDGISLVFLLFKSCLHGFVLHLDDFKVLSLFVLFIIGLYFLISLFDLD